MLHPKINTQEVVKLYTEELLSSCKIAEILNVSRAGVLKHLKKANVPIRWHVLTLEEGKEKKRLQNQRWRDKNREKVRVYARELYYKHHDKRLEKSKEYYQANRDRDCERGRQYRLANPEKTKERHRKYRLSNLEKKKFYYKEWRKRNHEAVIIHDHKRRVREKTNIGTFSASDWKEMKKRFNYTCPRCGKKEPEIKLTIDHIVPISKGGKHDKSNIQPLCQPCNNYKFLRTEKWNPAGQLELVL